MFIKSRSTADKFSGLMGNDGSLPFSKKIRKFRLEVKRNSNFPENPFGNCRLPLEVVLFFRSERNGGNFLTICSIFQFPVSHQPKTIIREIEFQMVSAISFGWFADFGKPLTIIQRSSKPVYSDKW